MNNKIAQSRLAYLGRAASMAVAVGAALPALVNEMTLLIKVSPAVAVVGVIEATRAAVRIGAATYDPIPPLLVTLAIYILVIGAFVAVQRLLERRRHAGGLT